VITDSGGIQEEAPTFEKPVLVLREVTERPEGVAAGIARIVGTDRNEILDSATRVLAAKEGEGWKALRDRAGAGAEVRADTMGADTGEPDGTYPNPYGDGRAGERIADIAVHRLTGAPRGTEDWSGPA